MAKAFVSLLVLILSVDLAVCKSESRPKRQGFWNQGGGAFGFQQSQPQNPGRSSFYDNKLMENIHILSGSSLWAGHNLWAEYFFIQPVTPRFPGSLFINMSIWVNQDLPQDIDAEFEIRAEKVVGFGENPFEFIPCHGYNVDPHSPDRGCGGVGSCRYCNVIDKYCKQYLNQGDCPPKHGRYSLTFTQTILQKDIPKSLFGPLKSTKYWIKTKLIQTSSGSEIACGMVVLDVCKFYLWDPRETCIEGS